jgi:hypothetical protein
MAEEFHAEPVVVAYVAESASEAMVIRGLLESAGIQTPGSVSTDPFPIPESPEVPSNLDIFVVESQLEEARALIDEYQKADGSADAEEAERESEASGSGATGA